MVRAEGVQILEDLIGYQAYGRRMSGLMQKCLASPGCHDINMTTVQ
jgi:hypothetical protein